MNPNRLTASEGQRIRRLLSDKVYQLVHEQILPRRPSKLRQSAIDRLLDWAGARRDGTRQTPMWLDHLWRAILLNRDRYSCPYCGRTAWDANKQLGAILRFELDHRRAKSRLKVRDDFDLRNIRIACRSCNVIKGQMGRARFLRELRSLSSAFLECTQFTGQRNPPYQSAFSGRLVLQTSVSWWILQAI